MSACCCVPIEQIFARSSITVAVQQRTLQQQTQSKASRLCKHTHILACSSAAKCPVSAKACRCMPMLQTSCTAVHSEYKPLTTHAHQRTALQPKTYSCPAFSRKCTAVLLSTD
jgi:hypothetical protein